MRPTLYLLLVLAAAPAQAEWLKVAETAAASYYLEAESIHKDGPRRKVWEVRDLNQPQKSGELSRRELQEYHCRGERFRSISYAAYSGPMAGGKLVSSRSAPADWTYVPYKTPYESVLRLVCWL